MAAEPCEEPPKDRTPLSDIGAALSGFAKTQGEPDKPRAAQSPHIVLSDYAYKHRCMYVYLYVCIYICVYLCIYIYIFANTRIFSVMQL